MSQKVVYSFPLKQDEEVRMSINEFKGNTYADIRVFFTSKETQDKIPSKRGISIRLERVDELIKGCAEIQKAIATEKATAD